MWKSMILCLGNYKLGAMGAVFTLSNSAQPTKEEELEVGSKSAAFPENVRGDYCLNISLHDEGARS